MQNFNGIMIINTIGYILGMGFVVIGKIGFKKLDKEFRELNCDISEMERIKRLPYLICTLIGYCIPVITSIILILVMLNVV